MLWRTRQSSNEASLFFLAVVVSQRPSDEPELPSLPSSNKEPHLSKVSLKASGRSWTSIPPSRIKTASLFSSWSSVTGSLLKHKSQMESLETTKLFFNKWMDKHTVVHPYNGTIKINEFQATKRCKGTLKAYCLVKKKKSQYEKVTYLVIPTSWPRKGLCWDFRFSFLCLRRAQNYLLKHL